MGIFSRITFRKISQILMIVVCWNFFLGSPVFLGGKGNITSEILFKKKIHSKGFSGCIRKFVVNGHQYELSQLTSNEIISTSNISKLFEFVISYKVTNPYILDECTIDKCSFVKCIHGGRCQSSSSICLCPLGFGGDFCEKKLDLNVCMMRMMIWY